MLKLSLEILASLYLIEILGGRKRMLHVFSRTEGLSGTEKRKSPDQLKVAVFGIGTVGSYAVEALARAGVGELIIITLLAGGMLEMIRYNGGIDYIIVKLTRHVNSKRAGELSIAGLVCLANLCTANNTIAVITIGPIAKNIADRFGIDCRKSASILDTFSCFIQGIIPYGAQMLIAAGLASISPLSIIQYLYYPMLIGICALSAIVFRYPRRYS